MQELTLPALMDNRTDPAKLGWPATFPLEIAMAEQPPKDICADYGYDKEAWDELRVNPRFRKEVADCRETLKEEGMSFKVKARLQSEELLKTSWHMIQSTETPASVRADLLKFTVRVAGLEPKNSVDPGAGGPAMQINIQLNA